MSTLSDITSFLVVKELISKNSYTEKGINSLFEHYRIPKNKQKELLNEWSPFGPKLTPEQKLQQEKEAQARKSAQEERLKKQLADRESAKLQKSEQENKKKLESAKVHKKEWEDYLESNKSDLSEKDIKEAQENIRLLGIYIDKNLVNYRKRLKVEKSLGGSKETEDQTRKNFYANYEETLGGYTEELQQLENTPIHDVEKIDAVKMRISQLEQEKEKFEQRHGSFWKNYMSGRGKKLQHLMAGLDSNPNQSEATGKQPSQVMGEPSELEKGFGYK